MAKTDKDAAADKKSAAKLLGRLGGLVGGPARAKALSPARRKAIAVSGGEAKRDGHKSGAGNLSAMTKKNSASKRK